MQSNLPEIKQLIADWYLLAQQNMLFVIALGIIIWILVAVLYNFKILLIKKKQKAENQLYLEVQSKLTDAENQIRQQQEQLATGAENQQKDQQLVAELKEKMLERNQAIVENIRTIAGQFDLNEQLAGSVNNMKEDFVWQQQDNIMQQLTGRLQLAQQENQALQLKYQQEIDKLGEKDSVITNLQSALDQQTSQFAQLEQSIQAQKLEQQQLLIDLQQQLSNIVLQQQQVATEKTDRERHQVQEQSVATEEKVTPTVEESTQFQPQFAEESEQKIVAFNEIDATPATPTENSEAESEVLEPREQITPFSATEPKPEIQLNDDVQDLLNLTEPTFSSQLEKEDKSNQFDSQTETQNKAEPKSKLNFSGKFNNLLGKGKKTDSKAQLETKVQAASEVNTADTESSSNAAGKFKNLLGKMKKTETSVSEPEKQVDTTASTVEIPSQEPEQKIETFIAEDIQAEEAKEEHIEPDYGASNFKMPGALSKLFGKAKK